MEGGAFYITSHDHEGILRRCEFFDGVEPSGNAVHAENLLRLYALTGDERYHRSAEDILKVAKSYIEAFPQGACYHLMALQRYLDVDHPTLIIGMGKGDQRQGEIVKWLYSTYSPHRSILWGEEETTTLYVCRGESRTPPITNFEEIEKTIKSV